MSTEPRFVYRADHPHGPNVIDRSTGKWMGIDLARQYAAVVNAVDAPPPEGNATEQARPYDQLPIAERASMLVEELDIASDRFTRCTNDPVDGLLSAAARMIEEFLATPVPEQAQPAGVTEDARDAARYRWIEKHASVIFDEVQSWSLETGKTIHSAHPASRELGVAIDAARAQEGEKP